MCTHSYDCICKPTLASPYLPCSDWSSLTALPESELVHDIFESDEDDLYEDEDDSNGEWHLTHACRQQHTQPTWLH